MKFWVLIAVVRVAECSPTTVRRPRLDRPLPLFAAGDDALMMGRQRGRFQLANQLAIAISRAALIDYTARGRDQRRPWVRALASVHPFTRLTLVALALLALYALWLRPTWVGDDECRTLRVATLHLCSVLLKLVSGAALLGIAGSTAFIAVRRAASAQSPELANRRRVDMECMRCGIWEERLTERILGLAGSGRGEGRRPKRRTDGCSRCVRGLLRPT